MKPGCLDPYTECPACKEPVGYLHQLGCDQETCARCGGQMCSCNCVYELNGMGPDKLEQEHPDIYSNGPTDEMAAVYDAEIEKIGGRIPVSLLWPGTEDAVRLGFWCFWTEDVKVRGFISPAGWRKCKMEHPKAVPDLNELARRCRWNREKRRYELPEEK